MAYKQNPYLNPFINNPYLSRMPMPNYSPQMKTPEQYQAELLRQLQPNLDAYNQQYTAYQQQQTIMNNSGQYIKVSNYDEVKQIQAPSDGKPIIIIDDANGFLYSKKFDNGQEYIKGFRLVPNEAEEEKKDSSQLDLIIERLNGIDNRLNSLEGKENGDTRDSDEQTKTS